MSDTTASLLRTIDSAGDLQAVVRAMKALAASSIGQYKKSVLALADYDRTVELGLGACLRAQRVDSSMIGRHARADPGVVSAVVFGSDQGLVGRFNDVVAEDAVEALAALPGGARARVWSVGERVHARLADAGVAPVGTFEVPSSVDAIAPLVGRIVVETETPDGRGDASELHLFYNRSALATSYAPVRQRLLPLDDDWRHRLSDLAWPTKQVAQVMGSSTATLRAFIREYVFVSLFRACAESLASENASRLAAMERADKNIDELLQQLHGKFQRLRQSGIDEELFDVIAGFEALVGRSRHA
jgi:F-type H+-transporting ATPase subunit gamma